MDVVVSWPATVDVSVTAEVNSVIMVTQCRTISHGATRYQCFTSAGGEGTSSCNT